MRLAGTSHDITARKEAEAAREELLASLGDQPLFGVALLRGPQLVFERANAACVQLLGGRDLVGKGLLEVLPEVTGQGFDVLMNEVQRTGVPFLGREMLARLDRRGKRVVEEGYFNCVYHPVRRPGSPLADILLLTHDVTDMVRARQEAERLVTLERERADFEQQLIGIVSHDLRNPLSAIRLSVQAILRSV